MRLGVELLEHVAIHAAFPYNRDQIRGQTSFEAYRNFRGGQAQVAPVRLVRRRSALYEVGAQNGANDMLHQVKRGLHGRY
jgi:hypothetical protein